VEIQSIDPGVASVVRGLPAHGVVVIRVTKGSPADKAGIRAASKHVTVNGVSAFTGGDAIVGLDRKPVSSSGTLTDLLAQRKPGDHVRLTVVRGSQTRTVDVTLGNVPM
jgi:2-alkenal reductase